MKNLETQREITRKVLDYKRAEGTAKTVIYNELFTELAPVLERRAEKFIIALGKDTLSVDLAEYQSVSLYEGFHKALESFNPEKNNNFLPYLYFCADNALKSQVGRDNSDKRKMSEQAITFTKLITRMNGYSEETLDFVDGFVIEDKNIEEIINRDSEPEMVTEFRKIKGDLKADVILCYTLEEDLQKEAICKVYGETEYEGKVKVRACRVRKEREQRRKGYG